MNKFLLGALMMVPAFAFASGYSATQPMVLDFTQTSITVDYTTTPAATPAMTNMYPGAYGTAYETMVTTTYMNAVGQNIIMNMDVDMNTDTVEMTESASTEAILTGEFTTTDNTQNLATVSTAVGVTGQQNSVGTGVSYYYANGVGGQNTANVQTVNGLTGGSYTGVYGNTGLENTNVVNLSNLTGVNMVEDMTTNVAMSRPEAANYTTFEEYLFALEAYNAYLIAQLEVTSAQ